MTAKILFVVSGAAYLVLKDGTRWATGYWAQELADPYRLLTGQNPRSAAVLGERLLKILA